MSIRMLFFEFSFKSSKRVAKSLLSAIVMVMFFAASVSTVSAATYYVDPVSGDDTNLGTSTGTAWRTIEKTLENGGIAQGDIIYLMAGTHDEFKVGTDNFINFLPAAGDSSGMVHIRPNPGDEGSVTISMPATTHPTTGYFYLNNPGLTVSFRDITFLNDSGGSPVAADWFFVRQGKLLFTNVVIDNNNESTKVIFNYKVTDGGGEVEIIQSTIRNLGEYLVLYNVGGTFKMSSSVVRNATAQLILSSGVANIIVEMTNNTLYEVTSLFLLSKGPISFTFVNNIVYFSNVTDYTFNTLAALELWARDNMGTNFIFTNNVIWKANITTMNVQPGWNTLVFDSAGTYSVPIDKSNRLMDPGFVNAPTDLSIAPTSHILGFGNNAVLPAAGDLDGEAWVGSDVGAYTMPSATQYQQPLIDGKVAFLGDSIFGCAGTDYGTEADCVYRKFETLTGLESVDSYVGSEPYLAAISGGRSQIGPWLADYIVDNHQPKVVFISLGINNVFDTDSTADNRPSNVTYQDVADQINITMQKLEDYGVIPVWMGILSNTDGQVEADAINALVEANCVDNDWTCVSMLDEMRLNPDWETEYYDENTSGSLALNLHPDKDGHNVMALLAQSVYDDLFPEPTPTPTPSPSPSSSPQQSSSESSFSAPGPAKPSICTNFVPVGDVDLFQINRTRTAATLYFTPTNDNVKNYHVIYGFDRGDERFGSISNPVTPDLNIGVQSLTISDLDPKAEYWFKVAPVNGCAVGSWSNLLKAERWKNKESFYYRYFGIAV